MKKLLALVLVMVLALGAFSASAFADTTYVGNSVYCEAGYENDVYNGVAKVLTLKDDGTFFLVDNTSIIHNSYAVVTSEEDPELLEDYAELTVECDNDAFSVVEA